jgi:hypothetical protein
MMASMLEATCDTGVVVVVRSRLVSGFQNTDPPRAWLTTPRSARRRTAASRVRC